MNVLLAWNGPANAAERTVLLRREVPMIRQLAADGIWISVTLFGDPADTGRALETEGISVAVLPKSLPPSAAALRALPAAVLGLTAILRALHPDVMEGIEPMPAIALGLAARRLKGRGVVTYRRQHSGAGSLKLRAASWLAARLAQRTVVMSEATRRVASLEDRTPLSRIELVRSGAASPRSVSPAEIAEERRLLGIGTGVRVIVAVSRFRHEKGLDVLLLALDALGDLQDVHVVIAGTGPEEAVLRELALRAPLPVHFTGHRDDVEVCYALADVVVMPSRRESFGRVSSETMASGRPLVASRVGGLVEGVVDGLTGLLVPPDDPQALAAALRMVLEERTLAARMGAAARERYEMNYTIQHMATSRREAWVRALVEVRPK